MCLGPWDGALRLLGGEPWRRLGARPARASGLRAKQAWDFVASAGHLVQGTAAALRDCVRRVHLLSQTSQTDGPPPPLPARMCVRVCCMVCGTLLLNGPADVTMHASWLAGWLASCERGCLNRHGDGTGVTRSCSWWRISPSPLDPRFLDLFSLQRALHAACDACGRWVSVHDSGACGTPCLWPRALHACTRRPPVR